MGDLVNGSRSGVNWVEVLVNPITIQSIYGDLVPSLAGVDIHELRLHRDASRATIRFDLKDFPGDPPVKWESCNTVQLELRLIEIEDISIQSWGHNMIADLSIERISGDLVRFQSNPVPELSITAGWISVSKISAYINSERQ